MRCTILLAGLVGALSLSACAGSPEPHTTEAEPGPQTVVVAYGAPTVLKQPPLRIALVSVADSRCEVNVKCVWVGRADVTIEVGQEGAKAERIVVTTPVSIDAPPDVMVGDYGFSLKALEPPNSLDRPRLEDYRATIQVRRRAAH